MRKPRHENEEHLEETVRIGVSDDYIVLHRDVAPTDLDPTRTMGYAVEKAVGDFATAAGVKDFYFEPASEPDGKKEELHDGAILTWDTCAVIECKAREQATDNTEREFRWLTKKVNEAVKQVTRNIRRLSIGGPYPMQNGSGREITPDLNGLNKLGIVVIEHPSLPRGFTPDFSLARGIPCVVITRQEWEAIFGHLQSTHATVRYLARVAGDPIEVGTEVTRFLELALKDEIAIGGEHSAPIIPLKPTDKANGLFRSILDDISASPIGRGPDATEEVRIHLLAALDTVHVQHQQVLSSQLLHTMDEVFHSQGKVGELLQTYHLYAPEDPSLPMIVVSVASHMEEMVRGHLRFRSLLFLAEQGSQRDYPKSVAGFVLTPSRQGREFDVSAHFEEQMEPLDDEMIRNIMEYFAAGSKDQATA